MFEYIPTVLRSQEIIDKSFKKASNIVEPYFPKKEDKVRKEVIDRISTIESISTGHFDKLIKKFPTIEAVHPFYYSLIDLMFDVNKYKLSLGKVQWTSEKIKDLSTFYIKKLKYARTIDDINSIMKSYYGRYSSLVNNIGNDLLFLGECRNYLKRLPGIIMNIPTFILAGMPNTGKSSLLHEITGSNPEIAEYPFTTRDILIAYRHFNNRRAQFIDTPGILDRTMDKRNDIEKKSIIALSKIDGIILFLMDYSGTTKYTVDEQEELYSEIKNSFSNKIYRIQTKIDISQRVEDIAVSTKIPDGIKPLMEIIESEVNGYYGSGN
ncbi:MULTISPECIES: GTPase [Acidiplasma]|uniref:GTPase n=1 Tax=Acidiplasma aeolicum TaxID=507754 RepID=A0A0P9F680_9ARCH|nr:MULTISPECIES: GTPase [Acidiplasma]KJE49782.1 GTPase [Acidiplasma sp. MBA-1]KPV47660.1 GTPase [Acidiplasma aeolicum]KQB34482.1 GTPase [Acidiplasma aeolicum]WMT55498.1 MAG: GTPase [Acidiplasma sp.]